MNIKQYIEWRRKNDYKFENRKNPNMRMFYAIGLGGEIGETLNLIKKLQRDRNNHLTCGLKVKLTSEFGDILWYMLASMDSFDINFDDIIKDNMAKIKSRNL